MMERRAAVSEIEKLITELEAVLRKANSQKSQTTQAQLRDVITGERFFNAYKAADEGRERFYAVALMQAINLTDCRTGRHKRIALIQALVKQYRQEG